MAKIGFIGLGNMGLPMAKNLIAAGHAVTGFDLSESANAAFTEAGGESAADAAAAAAGQEFVITMLPAGAHVRDVYENAVLPSASDGAWSSTSDYCLRSGKARQCSHWHSGSIQGFSSSSAVDAE